MHAPALIALYFLLSVLALSPQTLAAKADAVREQFIEAVGEADRLFDQREYARSLASLRRADQLIPTPKLHYNMAMCHEYLLEQDKQLMELNLYLETQLDTDQEARDLKDVARAKVDKLHLAARQAKADKPRLPLYKRWWLWTAVGTVAVATAGVTLGVFAGKIQANTPSGIQAVQTPLTVMSQPAVFQWHW